jgi:hypothetical protein
MNVDPRRWCERPKSWQRPPNPETLAVAMPTRRSPDGGPSEEYRDQEGADRLPPRRVLNELAEEAALAQRVRKIRPHALFWTVVLGFGAGRERTIAGLRRAFEVATGITLVTSAFRRPLHARADQVHEGRGRAPARRCGRALRPTPGPAGELPGSGDDRLHGDPTARPAREGVPGQSHQPHAGRAQDARRHQHEWCRAEDMPSSIRCVLEPRTGRRTRPPTASPQERERHRARRLAPDRLHTGAATAVVHIK